MILAEDLQKMSNANIDSINKSELVDIDTVNVDTSQNIDERFENYIEQIKNPYCFKVDNITVKIRFSENGKPLEDSLKSYFRGLKI